VPTDFIQRLPKAELHVHIEGTFEPELRFDLAKRNGISLPYADVEAVRAAYNFHDLTSFLVGYYDALAVLQTSQDFYDLAWAYLQQAHQENIRYAEIFFDPQAHTSRGVEFGTIVTGLRGAVLDAYRLLGVRAQLIMCILRDHSAEYAMATLLESLPYREWIIAIGLDSDEKGNPPNKFAEVFRRARAEGYRLTMHCDVDQQDASGHIRECVEGIGVDRIDHGVNILEDDDLVAEVVRRGLGMTVCPISNRYVTGDLKAKELKRMLESGLKVTVNSDDPAYFRAYLSANLIAAQEAADLSEQQLVDLERNAFEVSWLPSSTKDGLIEELERYAVSKGGS
jgi:adenosine deaminase